MEKTWSCKEVCWIVENYRPLISSMLVNWNKRLANSWKLNRDGDFMPLINKAGARGIVMKRNGNILMAFEYITLNSTLANLAKLVVLIGITWCYNQHVQGLEMELDMMLLVQMIQGQIQVPWRLQKIIEDIWKKMHQRNITITHCYRGSNEVVDMF